MSLKVALLHSRIRVEEKLLVEAFREKKFSVNLIDVRELVLDPEQPAPWRSYDVIVDRCLGHIQALTVVSTLEAMGCHCVNASEVTRLCGNKLDTSLALLQASLPTVPIRVAVSPAAAVAAIESVGYPAVLKPLTGSWGRLLARINDRDAAEAILEHKTVLGSVQHQVFYVQPFIAKANYDIRAFVVGDQTICAIKRLSDHWITNTARGATTENLPLTDELTTLCQSAARAVGGGMLAVDLFATDAGRFLINEVNATMEFRNSIQVTGVNIPQRMAEYLEHAVEVAR